MKRDFYAYGSAKRVFCTFGESVKNYKAFTLAEVLITLGIIGVVAAITIPMAVTKYQKHKVEVNLKKAYSMLNQVLIRSEADNGSAIYWDWSETSPDGQRESKIFINYFKPYLNVKNKIFKNAVAQYDKSGYSFPLDKSRGRGMSSFYGNIYELSNGFALIFSTSVHPNGTLGGITIVLPNYDKKHLRVGRDVFNFAIKYKNYKNDKSSIKIEPGSYLMWSCNTVKYNRQDFINKCKDNRNNGDSGISAASQCAMLIYCNDWKIPDDYPW